MTSLVYPSDTSLSGYLGVEEVRVDKLDRVGSVVYIPSFGGLLRSGSKVGVDCDLSRLYSVRLGVGLTTKHSFYLHKNTIWYFKTQVNDVRYH